MLSKKTRKNKEKDKEMVFVASIPYMEGDMKKNIIKGYNFYKYPLIPVWGHEYLEHWYEKIYEPETKNATIVLSGDSITQGYPSCYHGVSDSFIDQRGHAIKKIMKAGNFPMNRLVIINEGKGGRNSSEWIGNEKYALPEWKKKYPYGFLEKEMAHNPDLLIVAWGMNEADKNHKMFIGLSTEQRLNLFEKNMNEGLERIRGKIAINGRPSYNKKTDKLSIILCMPTVGGCETTGRGNMLWNQYTRNIVMGLCRKYECAFADMTMRTYAHNDITPRIWSALKANGEHDGIHPNKYSSAQVMSMLQDLIYPICMWNIDVSD